MNMRVWQVPTAPAPRPLVLVTTAMARDMDLRICCAPCDYVREVKARTVLTAVDDRLPIGELWINRAFRCRQCGHAATSVQVRDRWEAQPHLETWSLDEARVGERLRRHWRWYDRRDRDEDAAMCNNYRLTTGVSAMAGLFRGFGEGHALTHPEGVPNFEPNDDIRIGDAAPVVILHEGRSALVMRPWSWKGPAGKPVFNYRSEGRFFPADQRCLIPADGFYEFTVSTAGARRKDRWLFTHTAAPWFWILGVLRDGAFAMLTSDPGPDVKPYHDRQIVTLPAVYPANWLSASEGQQGAPKTDMRFNVSAAPRD